MIVVADTTPLNYLILIGEIDLLPALYRNVLIPPAVHRELQQPKAPVIVRVWASGLPNWCSVRSTTAAPDESLQSLDAGEREAIQLALEIGVKNILMDESEGRREAARLNLRATGTVAILEAAANRGLVDFRSTLERLEQTNFRLSASIRQAFLKRNL